MPVPIPTRCLDRHTDLQREALLQEAEAQTGPGDRPLVCAHCGTVVTRSGAAIEQAGAHEHAFTNPHGLEFVIGCFSEALTVEHDPPVAEYTWFPGYRWQISQCTACHGHLGWRFSAESGGYFYGLILDRIREQSAGPS